MTYKTTQIEGIGPQFAERLAVAGVHNTDDLMDRCSTEHGRKQLAAHAGLSTNQLETWMHQADLMRVSGIGSEFGQLLESSGVQSVEELSTRNPENVVNLLHRVNGMKKLTRSVPSLKTVSKWITRARELVPRFEAPASRELLAAAFQSEPASPSREGEMPAVARADAPERREMHVPDAVRPYKPW